MEGLDVDDVFQHCRLNPTEVEAVTYYLPRLLSGETLHGAEKLIHSVEISGCEPKDLAVRYAPAPQALSSGDRFFFTTCKSKNGSKLQSVRTAGSGTWTIQKTTEISHAGDKVGEVKNLSFKKKGKSTGWVMEEYRCLLPEATVAEGVKVFCRMHLAQHAPAAARQESAAYILQEPQPEAATTSTHAQKRPAPAAAADPHPPRPNKRMCVATPSFTAAAPVFLPDESIPEADDDDETLRVGATENISPLEAEENIEQSHYSELDEELQFLLDEAAAEHERQAVPEAEWQANEALGKDGEAYGFDIEELKRMMEADDALGEDGEADGFYIEELTRMMEADPIEVTGAKTGVEMDQREPLYLDCLDQVMLEDMLEDRAMHNPAFRDAEKEERHNDAPDLDAPSLEGHDHLFKLPPSFFDPFEAAWKAEEALENEMRNNTAANLLGGYDNFFSSASVH
ncbi:Dehydration-responsive element-binding protein 2B [Hordeum vulgare]|uniref:NAC domain-containing protein n=1 Tax=Hordeum vulgare subsp. vulgare TaxID=112509 RepID=A0A8I6YU16_HORVV|nr:protein NTM1-like 9 [Hordeum vulgare subsp. vulgare]KAE8778249.1 Dehydration-responsive element-binding protein 2B [Hordeum vulgare]